MTERFSVVIPWRNTDPHRKRLCDWVVDRWEAFYPFCEIVLADAGGEVFSRSKSRNAGVANCTNDVIVLADADTPPIRKYVDMGAEMAVDAPWVVGYAERRYYNLTLDATELLLAADPNVTIIEPFGAAVEHKLTSWAGMIMVTRENFEAAGGYDERFTGWGWEDTAFQFTMTEKFGKCERVPGFVVHLWHSRADAFFNTPGELANRKLFEQFYGPVRAG